MEEEILLYIFNKKKKIGDQRNILRALRDKSDPFAMSENLFRSNFRLPKEACKQLMCELQPYDRGSSLPFFVRFLCTLSFYAKGSYQSCVGNSFGIALSQSAVSNAITFVTQLIVTKKANEIRFPTTADEVSSVKAGFYSSFGIKGTLGAIDCTHVAIIAPPMTDTRNPPSLYMNRKGFYSLNVEAICDHRMVFTYINAQYPGSCHDSGIWTSSSARIYLMTHRQTNENTWLLGDQGYPLEPWLLTPVTEPTDAKEEAFNKIHARSRNIIERSFGLLKSRFRCLSKHRVLNYSHKKAGNIVNACAILHNVIVKSGGLCNIDAEEEDIEETPRQVNENTDRSSYFAAGQRVRASYINTL